MYHRTLPLRGVVRCALCCVLPVFFATHLNAGDSDSLIYHILTGSNGKRILVQPVLTGEVNLFRQAYIGRIRSKAKNRGPNFRKKILYRYFIGNRQVQPVDTYNYKPLVRKYLARASQLHQHLGKPGFRFENLAVMVQYYNFRHIRNETPKREDWQEVPLLLSR